MRETRGRSSSGGSLFQCIAPPKHSWTHVLLTADLRLQLNEQLRCLDTRVDTQTAIVSELQEYYRRRAEVEMEYSRSLDKLNKTLTQRHKDVRQKRDQMHLFSSYSCWQLLMTQTRQESKDRAVLSDIYANVITQRLGRISDDLQRIYKQCRQIGLESHEELLKVLQELQVATKTYNVYYTQFSTAEAKLQYVVNQKAKLETNIPKEKLDKSRKFRLVEKEILKRRNKYQDSRVKAVQARNDFILSLEAANAAVHRFFVDDISDIMDCMDCGFHTGLVRALLMNVASLEAVAAGGKLGVDGLHKTISNLDSRLDKQKFIEANNNAFMLPKKFEFAPHRGDELPGAQTHKFEVDPIFMDETQLRYTAICKRITSLRLSTEEVWKTMETAEKSLLEMVSEDDTNCRLFFQPQHQQARDQQLRTPDATLAKLRSNRNETEQFYMSKFGAYIDESNLIARLQAKYEVIRSGLGGSASQLNRLSRSICEKPRRKRIGRAPPTGQPKLFGGSLEEYLELSGQDIPLIIRSSVRVINQFGLHHQGIFRVSGSQVEINNFRDCFERGEDPLADITDASDINSVAGVLKLYLREMLEPFFPTLYFEQFMEIAQLRSTDEMSSRIAEVVRSLPRPVFIVMRYLFAFLNHLSEFSDENMMDPYNLAICFGPTLLPIPEDKDQVQFQGLVNELMKQIILRHEEIFPRDGGPVYEKYISKGLDEADDIGEAPSDITSTADDPDFETTSEDDSVFKERDISLQIFGKSEQLEAVAQFDFSARSPRELSFRCGDVLTLYRQISGDWWRGSYRGKEGLVPDKYVMLKIRDEDRNSGSESGGSQVLRASVSSESTTAAAPRGSSPSPSSASSLSAGMPEGKPRAGRSATIACPSSLLASPTPPRPVFQHSISALADVYPTPPSTSYGTGGWRRGRFASVGTDVTASFPTPAVSSTTGGRARCSSADRDAAAATGDQPSEMSLVFSASPEEDPESNTGQLDRAMRQIELVTETLRAAESSCLTAAPLSAHTRPPRRRSPTPESPPQQQQPASVAAVRPSLRPHSDGSCLRTAAESVRPSPEDRQLTVCSVWETRRSAPAATPIMTSSAAAPLGSLSSVRSRRALWENLASGGHAGAPTPAQRSSSRDSSAGSSPATVAAGAVAAPAAAVRQKGLKKHTPDLVRDLPPASESTARPGGRSSGGSSSSGSEEDSASPPSVVLAAAVAQPPPSVEAAATAAETFARQNQCTMRRGDRSSPGPDPGQLVAAAATSAPQSVSSSSVRPCARVTRGRPHLAQKPKLSPELLKKTRDL